VTFSFDYVLVGFAWTNVEWCGDIGSWCFIGCVWAANSGGMRRHWYFVFYLFCFGGQQWSDVVTLVVGVLLVVFG